MMYSCANFIFCHKVILVICMAIAVTYAAPNACSKQQDFAMRLAKDLARQFPKSNGDGKCSTGEGWGCSGEIAGMYEVSNT